METLTSPWGVSTWIKLWMSQIITKKTGEKRMKKKKTVQSIFILFSSYFLLQQQEVPSHLIWTACGYLLANSSRHSVFTIYLIHLLIPITPVITSRKEGKPCSLEDHRGKWQRANQNVPIWSLRRHQSLRRCPHGARFSSSAGVRLFCSAESRARQPSQRTCISMATGSTIKQALKGILWDVSRYP